MNHHLENLVEFFKTPLCLVFLVVSLFVSFILLNSHGFLANLYIPEGNVSSSEIPRNAEGFDEEVPRFAVCVFNNSSPLEDLLKGIYLLIIISVAMLLIFPSSIATVLFINNLQIFFPDWSSETFEFLTLIAFIYFNANYWIMLAYLIQSVHNQYLENKPTSIDYLRIFPNL